MTTKPEPKGRCKTCSKKSHCGFAAGPESLINIITKNKTICYTPLIEPTVKIAPDLLTPYTLSQLN